MSEGEELWPPMFWSRRGRSRLRLLTRGVSSERPTSSLIRTMAPVPCSPRPPLDGVGERVPGREAAGEIDDGVPSLGADNARGDR